MITFGQQIKARKTSQYYDSTKFRVHLMSLAHHACWRQGWMWDDVTEGRAHQPPIAPGPQNPPPTGRCTDPADVREAGQSTRAQTLGLELSY